MFKYLVLFSLIAMSACTRSVMYTYMDQEIDPSVLDEVHEQNSAAVSDLQNQDFAYLSAHTLTEYGSAPEFETQMREMHAFITALGPELTIRPYHDFYSIVSGDGNKTIFHDLDLNAQSSILYDTSHDTSFVCMSVCEANHKEVLQTIIFVKENNNWQIRLFHYGFLRIYGKDAMEWFTHTKNLYIQGYSIPAYLNLSLVYLCLSPAPIIKYTDGDKIKDFEKLMNERILSNISLPIHLPAFGDGYDIYGVEPLHAETLVPVIRYTTKLSINNEAALEEEAWSLIPELESLFNGLTKVFNTIVIKAYFEPPVNPDVDYPRYGTIIDLNKNR